MKKKKLILVLGMAICLLIAMSAETFATDGADVSAAFSKASVSKKTTSSDSDFITIYKPYRGQVFYKGEKISYKFTSWDTWEYYYTRPCIFLSKRSTGKYYCTRDLGPVPVDSYKTYTGTISTKKCSTGGYRFDVMNFAYETRYDDDFADVGNEPMISRYLTIKKLKAPRNLRVKASKKKITIRFNKVTGAKKYEIYKSKKKYSGFKKIKTTTSRKYVDRTVKKGRTYYYKVKSVRTGKGTVKSSFSSRKSAKAK